MPGSAYNIQAASFRGIPFGVEGTSGVAGRKVATHTYPFRDSPWVEDLGRADRIGQLEGFLLGTDVDSLRRDLTAAAEQKGPGTLVHPTRGSIQITLTIPLRWREGKDALGRVGFEIEFVEESEQLFPTVATDSASAITTAGATTAAASKGGFLDTIKGGLADVKSAINDVKTTVQPYISEANSLIGDARSIAGSVTGLGSIASSLTGGRLSFGRYSSGGLSSLSSINGILGKVTSVEGAVTGAISRGTSAVNGVEKLGTDLSRLGNLL